MIIDADRETKALTLDLDEAARKLANLEQLIGQTFTKENKTGTFLSILQSN